MTNENGLEALKENPDGRERGNAVYVGLAGYGYADDIHRYESDMLDADGNAYTVVYHVSYDDMRDAEGNLMDAEEWDWPNLIHAISRAE